MLHTLLTPLGLLFLLCTSDQQQKHIFVGDHPLNSHIKYGSNWPSGFRKEGLRTTTDAKWWKYLTWAFGQTLSHCCIEYTSPSAGFKLTILVEIGTDCTGSCTSNYYTTTTAPISLMVLFRDDHRRDPPKKPIRVTVLLGLLVSFVYLGSTTKA
jgi:hypothetical protein